MAYTIAELCERTGVSDRTVRSYIGKGLLERPPFRGTATLYGEDHLARILALRHLRRRGLSMAEIKKRLGAATLDELRQLVAPPPAEPPPAPASPPPFPASAAWDRVALLPGLELHVQRDAEPFVQRIAREIHELYRSQKPAE